jgi:hypothetical protein
MPLKKLGLLLMVALLGSPLLAQPAKAPAPAKPSEQPKAPKAIQPAPALEGPAWDGSQFVRADRKGNVFLFRGNTFQVYPETETGALGEPQRLKATAATSTLVHDAVLSPGGDQWLVYADIGTRLFVDGKEKLVPALAWRPWSISFLRDTPVVAVIPLQIGETGQDLEDLAAVPWLLSLGSGRWETLVDHRRLTGKDLARNDRDSNDFVAATAVFMRADHEGKLWVARQYAYQVERWSASGKPLVEIVVDGGKVEEKKTRDSPAKDAKSYHAFNAKPAILDLAEGTDHRMYFLVSRPDGSLVLDRYDPALAVLERVPLDLKKTGRFTLAAGKDGLYLAAWNGREGRWRIAWEELEEAGWKKVEEAAISGSSDSSKRMASDLSQGEGWRNDSF